MNNYNILILSAGRRVELIQEFKKAANKLNVTSKIVAGDASSNAPGIYFADQSVILPKINDPAYIDAIIKICRTEEIDLIVPTIDTDLLLLSKNKKKIEEKTDAIVLISEENTIKICRDKILTQEFLEENQFGAPIMYDLNGLDSSKLSYPLFIKPKGGSSSINTFKVDSKEELQTYLQLIDEPILQEYIGGEEYTVDVFVDFNGDIISVCPRLRIATRGGEIAKGRIVKDPVIIEDVKRLVTTLNGIGHLTVQLKKDANTIKYIEVNPRFGGGAPMSIQSGANSCEYLYLQLMGKKLEYNENYIDDLTFVRFDSSICIDKNGDVVDVENLKEGSFT